ncbi:hypothetical protein M5689_017132 [Euphorbia peplus]|nr:hypothetical protein M5689_017132 [Euphorbia peplus]
MRPNIPTWNYSNSLVLLLYGEWEFENVAPSSKASCRRLMCHHDNGEPLIVHCDLKPSNNLLSSDMTAHIGDYGLVRSLPNAANSQW